MFGYSRGAVTRERARRPVAIELLLLAPPVFISRSATLSLFSLLSTSYYTATHVVRALRERSEAVRVYNKPPPLFFTRSFSILYVFCKRSFSHSPNVNARSRGSRDLP